MDIAPPPVPITTIELPQHKPRPMARSRKKKHAPPAYDPARQSEFVELSASDILMECGPGVGEDVKVVFEKNLPGGPKKIIDEDPLPGTDVLDTGIEGKGGSDDEGIGVEQLGGGAVLDLDSEQAKVAELDRDGWEVIQADAAHMEMGRDMEDHSPPALQR